MKVGDMVVVRKGPDAPAVITHDLGKIPCLESPGQFRALTIGTGIPVIATRRTHRVWKIREEIVLEALENA